MCISSSIAYTSISPLHSECLNICSTNQFLKVRQKPQESCQRKLEWDPNTTALMFVSGRLPGCPCPAGHNAAKADDFKKMLQKVRPEVFHPHHHFRFRHLLVSLFQHLVIFRSRYLLHRNGLRVAPPASPLLTPGALSWAQTGSFCLKVSPLRN